MSENTLSAGMGSAGTAAAAPGIPAAAAIPLPTPANLPGAIAAQRPGATNIAESKPADSNTTFAILVSLSICHLLNDMNQSLVPALYPILKDSYQLDFAQIGLITLAFQLTASMLQPVVGFVTDKHPQPYSLPVAMCCSLVGLLLLAVANSYGVILFAAALVGIGSSVFHPESSRVARMASGGRYGFAQSLFQVGGSTGSAIGPLLAAFVVAPRGQTSIAWFSAAALLAMALLTYPMFSTHQNKPHIISILCRLCGSCGTTTAS